MISPYAVYQRRASSDSPLPASQLPDPDWDPKKPFVWPVVPPEPSSPYPAHSTSTISIARASTLANSNLNAVIISA
ncbi:hypothetical protein CC2G_014223 [Coprinopsis cinerea AmutBmut pab1-1]|nr:hypothetical protein CC2G_014223 [Coprinopsis cinerea AmutBmut pab1-1]